MTIAIKRAGVVIQKVKKLYITVDMTIAAAIEVARIAQKKRRGLQCQGQSSRGLEFER